jgi:hypothetical protein
LTADKKSAAGGDGQLPERKAFSKRGHRMGGNGISREEAVHRAILQLRGASDEELVAFVEREHGLKVDAKYLPIYRASLRAREYAEVARARAREAASANQEASKEEQSASG